MASSPLITIPSKAMCDHRMHRLDLLTIDLQQFIDGERRMADVDNSAFFKNNVFRSVPHTICEHETHKCSDVLIEHHTIVSRRSADHH